MFGEFFSIMITGGLGKKLNISVMAPFVLLGSGCPLLCMDKRLYTARIKPPMCGFCAHGRTETSRVQVVRKKKTALYADRNGTEKSLAASRSANPDIVALCALAGAMFLWAGTFIAMKVVLSALHPFVMMCARLSISSLLMLPFLVHWLRRLSFKRADLRFFALLIISEPCLYFVFEGFALQYTSASQAGLVIALLPVTVGISAFFALGEKLTKSAWAGCFLAVIGVVVLSVGAQSSGLGFWEEIKSLFFGAAQSVDAYGSQAAFTAQQNAGAPNPLLGNSLEFLAVCMATIYTLCVRKLLSYPPFFITALQAVGGAVFFSFLVLASGVGLPDELPSAKVLASLGFLSFATIIAYGLYNVGIARLSAARAAVWINLIPVITLCMGIFLLGESLGLVQSLAVPLIIGGLFLSQKSKR